MPRPFDLASGFEDNSDDSSKHPTMRHRIPLFFLLILLGIKFLRAETTVPPGTPGDPVSPPAPVDNSVGDWKLHLNALTYHFEDGEDNNETNWGLGLQRSFHASDSPKFLWRNWVSFWEIDVYQDSYYDIGVSGGVGTQRPLLDFIDIGFKAGLVYEAGLEEDNGSPLLPYLLPFFETSFDTRLNARLTIVPPVSDGITGIVTLQLILDL